MKSGSYSIGTRAPSPAGVGTSLKAGVVALVPQLHQFFTIT